MPDKYKKKLPPKQKPISVFDQEKYRKETAKQTSPIKRAVREGANTARQLGVPLSGLDSDVMQDMRRSVTNKLANKRRKELEAEDYK